MIKNNSVVDYSKLLNYNSRVLIGELVNKQLSRRGITRLWLLQISVMLAVSLFCLLVFGIDEARSAILGALVCILPNIYFARQLFKYQGARAARQIINSFYVGEAFKIFLTMILFAAVFVFFRITPLVFFGSYITILMTHWFAPLIIVSKQNRPESD